MIIKKLTLKNIRSYIDEEIKFPEKITLLSGDIGSGKSTTLLAIDFALFGIRRGELSGSTLLRGGSTEGYVILNFNLEDKEISIKRTLKKTSTGIVQDSGFITINDVTQQLTPVELKQKIIQLLNYPPETLTKKSLIYRYTVYTPQEEMKLILLGDKEHRLETLRKVFNIDKYKRIKENSKILTTEIKQRKKEFLGMISDLEPKKLKLKEKEMQEIKNKEEIEKNKKRLETTNNLVKTHKEKILEFENQTKKLNELKRDLALVNHTTKIKEEQKQKASNQLESLEKQILQLKPNIKEINIENLKENIIKNEKLLESLDKELKETTKNSIILKNKKQNSEEIKQSITKLDSCPLCKQNVSHQHKEEVTNREENNIQKLNQDLYNFIEKEKQLNSKLKEIKELLQNHKNQEKEHEINKIKVQDLKQKENLLSNLKKELEEINKIIISTITRKEAIDKELENLKDLELNYQTTKKELEQFQQEERKIELNLAATKKEQENITKDIEEIKEEIKNKEKTKEKLENYTKLQTWLEKFFINIIDLMEKKVMLRVHTDFDSLFQKWFSMLINTDLIKVRLDEEFTPLIEQNSHDIEYENLSGGEKTACALAYRLALNQVINTIVSTINTKDLIILDEPTDGFSTEQLDKVRDILQELEMNQIIIVSHESKIESYVDNIVKIQKEGHVSKIS